VTIDQELRRIRFGRILNVDPAVLQCQNAVGDSLDANVVRRDEDRGSSLAVLARVIASLFVGQSRVGPRSHA
jgi:hypothetical protein